MKDNSTTSGISTEDAIAAGKAGGASAGKTKKSTRRKVARAAGVLAGAAAVAGLAAAAVSPTTRATEANFLFAGLNKLLAKLTNLLVDIVLMGREALPAYVAKAKAYGALLVVGIVLVLGSVLVNKTWLTLFTGIPIFVIFFAIFLSTKKGGEFKFKKDEDVGNKPADSNYKSIDTQEGFLNAIAGIFGVATIYLVSIISLQVGLGSIAHWLVLYLIIGVYTLIAGGFYTFWRMMGHVGYRGLGILYLIGAAAIVVGVVPRAAPSYFDSWKSDYLLGSQAAQNHADVNKAALSRKQVKVAKTVGKYREAGGVSASASSTFASLISLVSENSDEPTKKSFVRDGDLKPETYTRFDDINYKSPTGPDTLIRLVAPNEHGESVVVEDTFYVVLDGKNVKPIDSKPADVSSVGSTSSVSADSEPETPAGWKEVARGQINVKNEFSDIGSSSGKTLIQVWGKATIDSTQNPFTPKGWMGKWAPDFYPLPGAPLFGAILQANGKLLYVGSSNEFDFPANTNLALGPNDEQGKDGLGFQDNVGVWNYKRCVPE